MALQTETIKKFALKSCHVDRVGIAPASALEGEPQGRRPTDILPTAKSVIVFIRRIPDGVVQSAFRTREDHVMDAQSIYAAYGSDLMPNMKLFFDSFNIAEFIERNMGFTSVPIACNTNQNAVSVNVPKPIFVGPKKLTHLIDPDHAAVAAGLGELGWNNLLVTPEHGPRQMIGLVVTSMELEYDEPYDGPHLCNPQTCGVCSGVCPMRALPGYGGERETGTIAGRPYEVAHINVNRCAVASLAFRSEFADKNKVPDQITGDDPTDEEIVEAYRTKPMSHNSVNHYPIHFCNRCMLYCPLGNWEGTFSERGLSRFDAKEYAE